MKIRTQLPLFAAALAVFTLAALYQTQSGAHTESRTPAYDLIIRNARIVDGTGNPWFRGDVAARAGRIIRVGRVEANAQAARTVDARGQILAPGFIDVHTHTEGIFNQPEAENFVRMGVTTLVTGNCGSSHTNIGQFLGRIRERPLAVNISTLIAHGSVRGAVMGTENRPPTPEETRRMEEIVEQAMQDGALGLSTGLIYVPGTYARTEEIVGLARVAARHGGIYATHMRDEGAEVMDAIRESIQIGEQAGLPVDISHFKISSRRLWNRSTETLGLVRAARARGLAVTVDQYAYTASSTSLDVLLPDWVLAGGRDAARARLEDEETLERVRREMREILDRSGFRDYSYAVVASYSPDRTFNGLNIKEIARRARGRDNLNAQIEQIIEMFKAGGAGMVYHKMNEEDVQRIMREPFTMIASDSGVRRFGEGVPHPRGYGNNARVLGHYVRELNVITIEDAIRKMSSLPAQTFGLRDRGLIREGMWADFVIFDDRTIADRTTFEHPHQYPAGIAHVFVNGQAVLDNNQMTQARPGAALRLNATN
jgi:N-acyl-D-amino-acid deacylase